jgi:aspartate/methionine/tyrosine aminotransferase
VNPLARELNEIIKKENPFVFNMLSDSGKELFYPKGILTQTAEAKEKAKKHDATIGIAKEGPEAMYLKCIMRSINGLRPDDIFPYAPTTGKPELRKAWAAEMGGKNPSLQGKAVSLPIVTSGLTHGLTIAGEMFVNPGDIIVLPDKIWGNYKMMFGTRNKAEIRQHLFFNDDRGFNLDAFSKAVRDAAAEKGKVVVILNFPNNPTGYSITKQETLAIRDILVDVAEGGCNVVPVCDDAYFGLFYEEDVMTESIFAHLADLHERILAIKLDGATKEDYVWGFRVGFITYSVGGDGNKTALYGALEKKTGGSIRALISNCPLISQSIILKAMNSPDYEKQKKEKYEIMKARAQKVKEVLSNPKYEKAWKPYPFNSGYFMCLRLKTVDAEKLRKHLLDKYGVGVISLGESEIRIAFSCLEVENIQDLFDIMLKAVQELEGSN